MNTATLDRTLLHGDGMAREPLSTGFKTTIWLAVALMLFTYIPAIIYVFVLDGDRALGGNVRSLCYVLGIYVAFLAPWLPTSGMGHRPVQDRIQTMVITWLCIVYTMAIIWELPWVLLVEVFAESKDAWWAFPWQIYAEGGDSRYSVFDPVVWTFEAQTVVNGIIGAVALRAWFRSDRTSIYALVAFIVTGTWHLYSTANYYIVDFLNNFSSVGAGDVFGLIVKFILVNSPFLILPCCVLYWAFKKLKTLRAINRTGKQ